MLNRVILLSIAWFFFIPSLLTGTLGFEGRLVLVTGLSLSANTITFIVAIVFFLIAKSITKRQFFLLFCISSFVIMRVSIDMLLSGHPEAYFKYLDGFGIGLVGACISAGLVSRNYESVVLFSVVGVCLLLLILAIITKLESGLLVRSNPYFMHGSIVFGRLMGVAFFFVLLLTKLPATIRISLMCVFTMAVFWSMSKGPIMALLLAMAVYFILRSQRLSILAVIIFAGFGLLLVNILPTINLPPEFNRVLVIFGVDQAEGTNIAGSVTIRQTIYYETINQLENNLLVGPGPANWLVNVGNPTGGFTYPHNIFLELLNDFGIILGVPLIFFFLVPLCFYHSVYFPLYIFLFLCQQVSGDMADGRFLIMVGALTIFTGRRFRLQQPKEIRKYAS